jgi:hypothetical protein
VCRNRSCELLRNDGGVADALGVGVCVDDVASLTLLI